MTEPLPSGAAPQAVTTQEPSLLDNIEVSTTPRVATPSSEELLRSEIKELRAAVYMLAGEVRRLQPPPREAPQYLCPVCRDPRCPYGRHDVRYPQGIGGY